MKIPLDTSKQPERQPRIFILKATAVDSRLDAQDRSRVFLLEETYPLKQFARNILDSFNFKCTSRELFFYSMSGRACSMKKTKIYTAFTHIGQRMILEFGPYNYWNISVELIEITAPNPEKKYPYIGQAIGKAPRQFPVGYTKKTIHKIWRDPALDDFENCFLPSEYYYGAEYAYEYYLATHQCPGGECIGKECLETNCMHSKNYVDFFK